MLYVNRSTWAHIVAEAARLMKISREAVLTEGEIAAIDGRIQPEHLIL
jgi:hypothetical protein